MDVVSIFRVEDQIRVAGVFCTKVDVVCRAEVPLQRDVATDHDCGDSPVFRDGLRVYNGDIAIEDAGADHAVAMNAQRKQIVSVPENSGHRNRRFDFLDCHNGVASCDPAHQGHE